MLRIAFDLSPNAASNHYQQNNTVSVLKALRDNDASARAHNAKTILILP